MNILFMLKSLDMGGVEVVTSVLANKFVSQGHVVVVFSFSAGTNAIASRFNERVKIITGKGYDISRENIVLLRQALERYQIDVIINQWGLPLAPIRLARNAMKGLDTKIISVYHNAPSFNGRIQSVNVRLKECKNPIKRLALNVQKVLFREVTGGAMRYIYNKSDRFLVLSDCYKEDFRRFTRIKHPKKLGAMANPVTIDNAGFVYNPKEKQKEIIYVGRLDYVQKRVNRVIDVWNYLEDQFPDWSLTLVGDGEERGNLENRIKVLGLKHVRFAGFQNPEDYYKRASMLIMTSEYEGFPLVLAEAMSFGVVPVVYHSFAAVDDIIENGVNGIVVPYSSALFPARVMAKSMSTLMSEMNKLVKMVEAAMQSSKRFGMDSIYKRWVHVLNPLIVSK